MSEPDFTVTIYCDDASHDPRDLYQLGHYEAPPGAIGALPWREVAKDPSAPDCLQTPFGEARRLWKQDPSRGPFDLPPITWHSRYRFKCPACSDTVEAKGEAMERLLDGMRQARDTLAPSLSLGNVRRILTT